MSRFSLDGFFELKASGTTVKQEILGGLTTFVAMSYLIFVVPAMLADAGMDVGYSFSVFDNDFLFGIDDGDIYRKAE